MSNKPTKSNKVSIEVSNSGDIKELRKEPDTICNARLRYKGGYCQNKAGFGTDHEGTGRCKDHGGAVRGGGRPRKTYMASEFMPTDILKKFEGVSDTDPLSISNLDNEITVLRAILYEYLKKCFDDNKKLPNPDDLKKYVDTLSRLVDLKNKLEVKPSSPARVTANIFVLYVNQINNILRKHIDNPVLLNSIADELESLVIPAEPDSNERL